jgi:hypothetical protein
MNKIVILGVLMSVMACNPKNKTENETLIDSMRLVGIRLLFNEQKGDKPLIKSFPDLEDAQTRRVKHSGLVNVLEPKRS